MRRTDAPLFAPLFPREMLSGKQLPAPDVCCVVAALAQRSLGPPTCDMSHRLDPRVMQPERGEEAAAAQLRRVRIRFFRLSPEESFVDVHRSLGNLKARPCHVLAASLPRH